MVSITPRNIYSRFISFIVICFTSNSSSNKKIFSKKKCKIDFCRTRASDYGDLYHQGVTENELGGLSCLHTIFPTCVRIDETKTFHFSDILLLDGSTTHWLEFVR